MDYLQSFLSLKCSGDVLNICNPLGKKAKKEITESIGAIKKIKPITLKSPMQSNLYDFCAGNALTSIISSFLLPIKHSYAIDIRPRKRDWHKVKRFSYLFKDIYNFDSSSIEENDIILSVHACNKLSEKVVDIYNNSNAKYLVLIPCCIGKIENNYPQEVRTRLGKYIIWCWQLANKCNGKFTIDKNILSPKNIVITSEKRSMK